MSSTEKDTRMVKFLSLQLDSQQAKFGQWVLLALSFVLFLVALLLACRLYSLEKRSLTQDSNAEDTNTQDTGSQKTKLSETPANTYFLGIAMEPSKVAKRQWILLSLCLILMLCSIILTIRIFTQHNRKPPWMSAEWWSLD